LVKRTLPTNPKTRRLIKLLRKASSSNESAVWRTLSDSLSTPTRQRVSMNVSKIDRLAEEGDVVAIPGKVLGFGNIGKKVDVAALSFSQSAKDKIAQAGGKALTFEALMIANPHGKNVRILR
jgi:large subunit ribosomal protein L18e